jgi:hypothetical protein
MWFRSREHHRSDLVSSRSRVQRLLIKTDEKMMPFPQNLRGTTHSPPVLRMEMESMDQLNSDDDWKIIQQIKNSFEGVDHSRLGKALNLMIDSRKVNLGQLESACLRLSFLTGSLQAALEEITQPDERDGMREAHPLDIRFDVLNIYFYFDFSAEPNGKVEDAASGDTGGDRGGEGADWIQRGARDNFVANQQSNQGCLSKSFFRTLIACFEAIDSINERFHC